MDTMFLLTEVTWYASGRQALYTIAVSDNVPTLQSLVSERYGVSDWQGEDALGLIRTTPRPSPSGMGEVLYSISLVDLAK